MRREACSLLFLLALLPVRHAPAGPEEHEPDRPPAIETARTLQSYDEQIARLEAQGGALNPLLAEALLAAGAVYSAAGRHDEALQVYRRALHISRVNEGLHNLAHAHIVERILESGEALGDIEAQYRDFRFLYWIHRRNLDAGDPRLVSVADRIARWGLGLRVAGEYALEQLLYAEVRNKEVIDMLEARPEDPPGRLLTALYRSAVFNYYLAVDALSGSISITDNRAKLMQAGRRVFDAEEWQARYALADESFERGRSALSRIEEITTASLDREPARHAEALVFGGDWYNAFQQPRQAVRRYRDAWKLLADRGLREELDRVFGRPHRVGPLSVPGEEYVVTPSEEYVVALIRVPASGRPRDIRIVLTEPPDDARLARRASRSLSSTVFRPRFEDGEPVVTTDLPVRVYFEQ